MEDVYSSLSEQRESKGSKDELNKKVRELLHSVFRPEFLNRLDDVIIYNPLTAKEILEIAKLQLALVAERMRENNITLETSEDVVMYIAEEGYDAVFGARPLKRLIEEKIVDPIALKIVENQIKPGDIIKPKIENGKVTF